MSCRVTLNLVVNDIFLLQKLNKSSLSENCMYDHINIVKFKIISQLYIKGYKYGN